MYKLTLVDREMREEEIFVLEETIEGILERLKEFLLEDKNSDAFYQDNDTRFQEKWAYMVTWEIDADTHNNYLISTNEILLLLDKFYEELGRDGFINIPWHRKVGAKNRVLEEFIGRIGK